MIWWLAVALAQEPAPPDTASPEPAEGAQAPDFATAVGLRPEGNATGALLHLDVADGFTVYGAKERMAVPLSMEVAGGKAKLPAGDKKHTDSGVQRVLHGEHVIEVKARSAASQLEGTLTYQACFESLCGPPQTVEWVVQR